MKFITAFKNYLNGKKEEATKELQKSPAYWEGMLAKNESKLDLCKTRHTEALAKVRTTEEKIEILSKLIVQYEAGSKRAGLAFKETGDVKKEIISKEAFTKVKEMKAEKTILEQELEILKKTEEQLRAIKNTASATISKNRIIIQQNKAKVEFSKTMKGLTEGMSDISLGGIEGSDVVSEDFHINNIKLEEMSLQAEIDGSINNVDVDDEYEKFMKGE